VPDLCYTRAVAFFEWILHNLRDPGELIRWGGYPALTAIIFLETGAMIFFLPGDSLLFVAGLFAGRGDLHIGLLQALLIPAAILGDATSYYIGKRLGPAIFRKQESRFFKPSHVEAARAFYEKHGGKAIIIARFMPLVRTFVPVVAGVAKMRYRDFFMFNIVGAAAWILSMTLMGFFLGQFEWVGKHVEKIIIAIVVISVLPGALEWWKHRNAKPAEAKAEDATAVEVKSVEAKPVDGES
jgi:membrane-associated protein